MGNRRVILLIIAFLFLVPVLRYPQILGIVIFLEVMAAAWIRYREVSKTQDKPASVKNTLTVNTHDSHHAYSASYSLKKTESPDAVKDSPLSEAERNVLYGR